MEKTRLLKDSAPGQQFHWLVQSVKDYGIFLMDPQGYIQTWNPGAARIKDYTADEVIGQHFSLFYTQKDRKRRKPDEALRIALVVGQYEEQGWRVRKDQTLFKASVVITPVYDYQGQHTGFAKVIREVTERSLAEPEASSRPPYNQFWSALIDTSPAGLAWFEPVYGPQNQIIDFSVKFLGKQSNAADSKRSVETLAGQSLLSLYPNVQTQPLWQQLLVCYQTGRSQKLADQYAEEGISTWIEGTLIKRGHEVLGVFQDVTLLKRVQLELEQQVVSLKQTQQRVSRAYQREQEMNRLKTDFVKLVTHQFRTPMTSILLNAELLKRHGERSGDKEIAQRVVGYTQQVVGQIHQLNRLISNVLVHERVQLNQITAHKQRVDLVAFCQNFLHEQNHQEAYHRVVFRAQKPQVDVQADPILLEQVLENLISNALKYSNASNSPVEVTVTASARSGKLLVKDYGIGIPAGELKHLTRSFFRASNAANYSGTGLGLSLTTRLVKLQGGRLTIDSEQHHYTQMTVRLPL